MNKKFIAVMLSLLLVGLFACKKKEQQPIPQMQNQAMPAQGTGPISPGHEMPVGHGMPSKGLQVVVPEGIKGKWSGVKIIVQDKIAKKSQEYTLKLNSDLNIPDSDLKVTVGEFLPDFIIDSGKITSASSELNNPAVGINVMEGNKQVFPVPGKQWGWLWLRKELQSAHPFEHPRYDIVFKEPVKKI